MGTHHGHTGLSGGEDGVSATFVTSRRTSRILLAVLVPILMGTGVAMLMLWPKELPPSDLSTSTAAVAGQRVPAEVNSSSAKKCKADPSERLPDGSIPTTTTCAFVVARIGSGPDKDTDVTVAVPPSIYRSGIAPGDRINLTRFVPADAADAADVRASNPNALSDGTAYAWLDFSRSFPLGALAVIFAVLVIGVARLRGLAAIVGLVIAYLTIIKFMLPALRLGEDAVAVAVVGSIAVMTVILYLAHGVSAKTTTALLGTIFGLVLSGGLAAWASAAAHLNGMGSEENYRLSQLTGGSDLSGIILCGIIVAGLGVLNDVTITQASAVWEVHAHAPTLGVRALFTSGMRVGRDHLASTVYTIAFAYAGAALPTLILIDLYDQPLTQVLTSGTIAEEIARTLVGSIGLILAIPLTTIVAAFIVASGRDRTEHEIEQPPVEGTSQRPRGRRVALATGGDSAGRPDTRHLL